MKPAAAEVPLFQSMRRLWAEFSKHRQRQFALVFALMLLSAFAEVASLGAVLPFLTLIAAPQTALQHPAIALVASALHLPSPEDLLLPLTFGFVGAALASMALRLAVMRAVTAIGLSTGSDFSTQLYRRTLYQPYETHVARNSSEVISGITHKVDNLIQGVLLSTLNFCAACALVAAIMVALLAIDLPAALASAAIFGGSYVAIAWGTRRQIRIQSEHIARDHVKMVKSIQEGLGGIRDVLLDGTQELYCRLYENADRPFRAAQARITFVVHSPRFLMEGFGTAFIALLAYALGQRSGGSSAATFPVLGALALGALRMLPALQQAYSSWVALQSSRASLADILELLEQPIPAVTTGSAQAPLAFAKDIEFKGIRFHYAEGPWVLDGIDLRIPRGSRVGFVGKTGSGKSTLLDVLMGLLRAREGEIRIDGRMLSGTDVRAWQRIIAHVPQSIFLADTTLAENIALGVEPGAIDRERVEASAVQAQLHDFVQTLPKAYGTHVGERGVRLSGGQRQRIGIARALYKQASVLVFDEATSALDNATEHAIIESITALGREYTVLIIAHRLSTVRHCDFIVHLEGGRVAAQGTYEDLLARSEGFRRLAQFERVHA
jgi:ABC-type multidrug transport system fused ATPase/permease subunit